MQPQTTVKFDRKSFNRIKKTIKNISKASHESNRDSRYASNIPEEVDIQLTYRCNLRCKQCYQWNEYGHFKNLKKEKDIDVNIVEKIFKETSDNKSNIFLWGGEPLLHREWESIAWLLEKDPRWTVLCTNGLLLEEKIESILRISKNLALLVSLDGFQEAHDGIRGNGAFKRTKRNLDLLFSLQRKGEYKGTISINCVLNEGAIPKLFDFMEYFETQGVDTVYFNYPWYISEKTAKLMDNYYETNFSWLNILKNEKTKPSWHSYTYHLDLSTLNDLYKQIDKLSSRTWKKRIRFQPALERDEIRNFLIGDEIPVPKKCQCLAISNRIEVHADGTVSACKFYPEMSIGNLHNQSLIEIWKSDIFGKVRERIYSGLMPVCSKCILLYLNGR